MFRDFGDVPCICKQREVTMLDKVIDAAGMTQVIGQLVFVACLTCSSPSFAETTSVTRPVDEQLIFRVEGLT